MDGSQLQLSLEEPEDRKRLGELTLQGQIKNLFSREASLEDVFIKLTGRRILE
jgi:hypothetical protein